MMVDMVVVVRLVPSRGRTSIYDTWEVGTTPLALMLFESEAAEISRTASPPIELRR